MQYNCSGQCSEPQKNSQKRSNADRHKKLNYQTLATQYNCSGQCTEGFPVNPFIFII